MKVTIDIECTPVEARAFLGLPDVSVLNDRMVEEMVRRMEANMDSLEPEALMRQWTAFGGQMTDNFMSFMQQAASAGAPKSDK
ncbi:DUF6489 family protein [Maricaulis sp.]|uniref:DUF6489 family protein n=1 Tax=Maricaulis sp. TaxID=1486257 RepID=UPI00262BEEC1|nr:DUF6489 family protein [Maricaulis sp.]